MELRHLRYFVAVAEELHFGRAAARLHIAQPPLSQQIKMLEQELNAELFHRTKRHVELTDAGRLFLPEAKATLDQAKRAGDLATAAAKGTRGHLAIGFVTSSSYTVLPAAVLRFREQHPGIQLDLREMIPARQVEALERRELDIGIMRPPVQHPDMIDEVILHEPMVAALPTGHTLAKRSTIQLKSLRDDAFILFPRKHGPGLFDVITEACRQAGFTCQPAYEPNDMQTILAHVASGLGVSIVPASVMSFHRDYIRYVRIQKPTICISLNLVTHKHRSSTTVTRFTEIAREIGTLCVKELKREMKKR